MGSANANISLQVPTYDPSQPTGGNPLDVNVNAPFTGLEYHAVWNMIMGFLVWLIIPGIGLLYGGLARRKSSLALLFQSVMVMAVGEFSVASTQLYVIAILTRRSSHSAMDVLGIFSSIQSYWKCIYW